MAAAEVGVVGSFFIRRRLPIPLCVVYGAVMVYSCGEEVWCAFLGGGAGCWGLDG